ncbi:hypothetical protein NDU88_006354 [Pleurodeles waltl]|uniref:Uncharacterized protein n=1 Tax=Pleurodeles waltl TaxID=8319 RepID=A0AAV7RQ05_PLEWA|nr:hypothetical protein NDU88_006354 [Pleurodeles waltl]
MTQKKSRQRKRNNGQGEKREDAGPETGEWWMHNREDAGPEEGELLLPRGNSGGPVHRKRVLLPGLGLPRRRANSKREEKQRTEQEDAGLRQENDGRATEITQEPGTRNGEDTGPEKEEEEVPKEADNEEECVMASEAGWKAD